MDDDVVPAVNCLEILMKFAKKDMLVAPQKIAVDGSIFCYDIVSINLSNPFKSI